MTAPDSVEAPPQPATSDAPESATVDKSTSPLWPADKVERRPIASLEPFIRNARMHSAEQVKQIVESIKQWGWTVAVLIDEAGGIIAGHARVMAARQMGLTEVPVVVARGWTDLQKRAYVLADNKLTLNSSWDEHMLALEIRDLKTEGFDLGLAGFSEAELDSLDDVLDQTVIEGSDGSLLALVDIVLKEPKHKVERGDVWKVGAHWLHCCSVMTGWPSWSPKLQGENVIFCPYPGAFVPLGDKAATNVLIMVQPDPYISGHILDRFVEVNGPRSIERTVSGADQ